MAVDYDLVIIGSSKAGLYAAQNAVRLQARVALVTQTEDKYLLDDALFLRSLGELGRGNYRQQHNLSITPGKFIQLDRQTWHWLEDTQIAVQNLHSLADLSALGVDVIVGQGEFFRLPYLGLRVNQRTLRSRNYLLATGTSCKPVFLERNHEGDYLTLKDLQTQKLIDLPTNLIVVGGDPTALSLAQGLARFNRQVTLVVEQSRILPQEDLDLSGLIQAQLEAESIEIFTNSQVSQLEVIDGQKCLQIGDRVLRAEAIIIADGHQPNIAGLNLAGVGVKYDEQKVLVNRKLQTTNSKIYACGGLIGGYSLPSITRYEVNLILKNTLFIAKYKTNYHLVPWAIDTQPNLARVGLNESRAKQLYPADLMVIKQYFDSVEQAQVVDKITGFCKLLVRTNGEILGCSIIGDRGAESIAIPALMMQHKIKLDPNPMRGLTSLLVATVCPSMAEILTQAGHNFYQQKIQQNTKLLNRLKSWFSWRKN